MCASTCAVVLSVERELALTYLDEPVLEAVTAPAELQVHARGEHGVGVRRQQVDEAPEVGEDRAARDAVQVVEDHHDVTRVGQCAGEILEERLAETVLGCLHGRGRSDECAGDGRHCRDQPVRERAGCTIRGGDVEPDHGEVRPRLHPLREEDRFAGARGRDDQRQRGFHPGVELSSQRGPINGVRRNTAWFCHELCSLASGFRALAGNHPTGVTSARPGAAHNDLHRDSHGTSCPRPREEAG